MRHARALAEHCWPGAPRLEAQKRVVWIPTTSCGACGRGLIPRTASEDLFGVFDLISLAPAPCMVQVTTWAEGGSAAYGRMSKVKKWLGSLPPELDASAWSVAVWAWVPRRHFYAWTWNVPPGRWGDRRVLKSPLMKR